MLGRDTYSGEYIAGCRSKVDADVAAYRAGAKKHAGFEAAFFNNMVIVLDALFTHRLRNKEGKDGNALNEARLVADSLMTNDGKLRADKQIKLDPSRSVLGLAVDDDIAVDAKGFSRLAKAFFTEIESRYA